MMTANGKACCALTDNLAEAARSIWEADCRIVPVVAEGGKVVGLITDRDICMAAMTKGRNESSIAIEDVIPQKLFACKPEDDIRSALNTMRDNKVRRPSSCDCRRETRRDAVNERFSAQGPEADNKKAPELPYEDVVNTYKSICQHQLPMRQSQAAVKA